MITETKIFGGKKIIIREFSKKDVKNAKAFLDFINSFVDEDAMLSINKKKTLGEEKDWLRHTAAEKKERVYLLAECDGKIVAAADIGVLRGRQSHIGEFGITVREGYRGIGLGEYIMRKTINLARKRLTIKIIQLKVFTNNKPANGLYKKMGFRKIASIPHALQYKGRLMSEYLMFLYL